MKKITSLLAILLITIALNAQSNEKTFHLKNGSIIKGIVIEEKPGTEYKVQTSDGNIFVFKAEEIDKITQESSPTTKVEETPLQEGKFFYSLNEASIGGMFYGGDDPTYNFGLSTINGININNQFYFGLGIEYQWSEIGNFVPIFIDARMNLKPTKKTPFAFINVGYAISTRVLNFPYFTGSSQFPTEIQITYKDGFIGRLGLGYKSEVSESINANISIFFTAHEYAADAWLFSDQFFKDKGIYSIIGMKLGIDINPQK